jgi:alpha-ketoglutarate-dependent taurine dioxygenase
MGDGLRATDASPECAIIVEPLSAGVGLHVGGVNLHALSDGAMDLIKDLWQVGGALLFRQQADPSAAALKLASALAGGPGSLAPQSDWEIGEHWSMLGAYAGLPPNAVVLSAGPALPPLGLAGMEAAADALRMENPSLFAKLASVYRAHVEGGPPHPLIHRHALSGESCLYPPPKASADAKVDNILHHAEAVRFCYTHNWMAGDVLAFDPRAVRCRWFEPPSRAPRLLVLAGSVPLAPVPAPLGVLEQFGMRE